MPRWKVGDRVTRERRMDDGTWIQEGDDCLPGPLRHGEVVAVVEDEILLMYRVRWDDSGAQLQYFGHGIDAERGDKP